MTLPTPISVLKGPRPLDESNLEVGPRGSASLLRQLVRNERTGVCRYVLLASEIIFRSLGLVVEIAGVLDGDGIPFLGFIGAIALSDDLPSDTHYESGPGGDCSAGCGRVKVKMK